MQVSESREVLEFRLALLERAVAENTRQTGELMQALARLDGAPPIVDTASPQTIIIDADAVAPFDAGFHRRETDASGRAYRWTGNADFFELRFALNRNLRWTFEMTVMGNDHVDLTILRAFADYAEIPVQINSSRGLVCGSIPLKPYANVVTLTFHLPSTFVPSELDASSPDHRCLSVVFYGMKIVSVDARTPADAVPGQTEFSGGGLQETDAKLTASRLAGQVLDQYDTAVVR